MNKQKNKLDNTSNSCTKLNTNIGYDSNEISATSTEDLFSLQKAILKYLKTSKLKNKNPNFLRVLKGINEEISIRKINISKQESISFSVPERKSYFSKDKTNLFNFNFLPDIFKSFNDENKKEFYNIKKETYLNSKIGKNDFNEFLLNMENKFYTNDSLISVENKIFKDQINIKNENNLFFYNNSKLYENLKRLKNEVDMNDKNLLNKKRLENDEEKKKDLRIPSFLQDKKLLNEMKRRNFIDETKKIEACFLISKVKENIISKLLFLFIII